MTATFDLLNEPWILCRGSGGEIRELSILETFAQAHELRALVGEVPTQQVAITRLLLAILSRATPRSSDPIGAWEDMWKRREFDMDLIVTYTAKYAERFDLLHPVTPFYQVAELRTTKGEFNSLSRLIADVPAGEQFFTTRSAQSFESLTFAEAARWLVHAQAFDPAGIKSGAVGDSRTKQGKGFPIKFEDGGGPAWCGRLGILILEGACLFETLMLNMPSSAAGPDDSAVWERSAHTAGVEAKGRSSSGPIDLLTWQSRRIRIHHDGTRAVGVLLGYGDPLRGHNMHRHEKMTSWRRSVPQQKATGLPEVYMPRRHLPDRSIWRGLGGLLGVSATDAEKQEGLPAGNLEWLATLRDAGVLHSDYVIGARAVGAVYGTQDSVFTDLYEDAMLFHTVALSDGALIQAAVDAARDADLAVRCLGDLARDLALAAGGDPAGPREAAKTAAYAELDSPYREWAAALTEGTDPLEARTTWQVYLRRMIDRRSLDLIEQAGLPALLGRKVNDGRRERQLNAALAERYFRGGLRRALPYAYPDDATKETADESK